MKLGTKTVILITVSWNWAQKTLQFHSYFSHGRLPAQNVFALFAKKKRDVQWGFYKLAKKLFFEFQKMWNRNFFFFSELWDFSEKLREKKHKFHFQIAKILNFLHQKKIIFCKFTLVHRHLLNSRETVSSFTAVSLKLTWNSKNGQSFTETGCQKYGVFGMKSAKSTVSSSALSTFFETTSGIFF